MQASHSRNVTRLDHGRRTWVGRILKGAARIIGWVAVIGLMSFAIVALLAENLGAGAQAGAEPTWPFLSVLALVLGGGIYVWLGRTGRRKARPGAEMPISPAAEAVDQLAQASGGPSLGFIGAFFLVFLPAMAVFVAGLSGLTWVFQAVVTAAGLDSNPGDVGGVILGVVAIATIVLPAIAGWRAYRLIKDLWWRFFPRLARYMGLT